jgi:hypothetical protein
MSNSSLPSENNTNGKKIVSVLKILWDGKVMTAEFEENSQNDNEIRKRNKRKRQLFEALTNAEDGELIQTFQVKLNKVVLSYQLKANLFKRVRAFNIAQRTAFDLAKDHISTLIPNQMIMLLIGDGGTGKSFVAQALCKFTFLVHDRTENGKFPSVMLDSKLCPFKALTKPIMSDEEFTSLRKRLENSVLIVIENVNFVSLEELQQMSSRLAAVSGKIDVPFGGFHVVMVGDLQKSDSSTLHNGGTHLMSYPILAHKKKAIAGQSILINALTHCVDITNSKQATFDSFADCLEKSRAEKVKELLRSAAAIQHV